MSQNAIGDIRPTEAQPSLSSLIKFRIGTDRNGGSYKRLRNGMTVREHTPSELLTKKQRVRQRRELGEIYP